MKIAKRGHRLFLRAGLLAGAVIIGAFLLLSITRHQAEQARRMGYPSISPEQANSSVYRRHQTKV
jgi:hypothetical protein